MAGRHDSAVFANFAEFTEWRLDYFRAEDLAKMAWACAAANYYSEKLFGPMFEDRCEAEAEGWVGPDNSLSWLHQWVLWHRELGLSAPLSPELRRRCLVAFSCSQSSPSQMHRELVTVLKEIGVQVEEEVVTEEGYRINVA